MREVTDNGHFAVGDIHRIELRITRITSNGAGVEAEIPLDGGARGQTINISARAASDLVSRVRKTPGQLLWESIRDEAATRPTDAHPTQPWDRLTPEVKAKYEERAELFTRALEARGQ
jgi:hypothetical protein